MHTTEVFVPGRNNGRFIVGKFLKDFFAANYRVLIPWHFCSDKDGPFFDVEMKNKQTIAE